MSIRLLNAAQQVYEVIKAESETRETDFEINYKQRTVSYLMANHFPELVAIYDQRRKIFLANGMRVH